MNDYEIKIQSILNDISGMIEEEQDRTESFLRQIFTMLFWKDFHEGYVDPDSMDELIELIDGFVKHNGHAGVKWYEFNDMDHVCDVVKKVRDMIGLKEELPRGKRGF